MARRLIVEIIGDSSGLQAALGRSAAAADGFGARMQAVGSRISSVGHKLTRDLTLPIAGIGVVATKSAIDFQSSMELLHTQAGVSQGAIEGLSKAVLGMAGSVATGPEELTTGLYHLASQGLRGKQALDALRTAAEGAKVGQANLEDVTNALGATLVSHIGGFKTYTQAMGQLNAIVGSGDMHMQDLADAMGTGLPAKAAVAGVSLRDVGAALAVFGDNNIRGAQAGTLLNSTLRLMEGPSKAAAKAMGEIGLNASQFGTVLRSKGLVAAVEDLKTHLAGLSKADQFAALTHMFGGRQAGGVMVLIDQLERLKQKEREVADGGNKFASDWAAYTKTTSYHLASMGAQMQAAGVTIGDVLLPVVAKVADFIGRLASKFESLPGPVKSALVVVGGIVAAIGPVVSVIGSLTTALGFLAANPIVLLIAGIGALVAGIVAAVVWPDKLRAVLEHMGLSAHAAGEVVRGLQDVFHVVEQAGEALVGVIRANWSTIKQIVSGAVDIVKTVIRDYVAVVEGLWRTFGATLTSAAETYWGAIKNTIRNALTIIHGVIDVISGLIHGDWSKVWNGIREIVSGTLSQIRNVLSTAVSLLGDAAKLIGTAIWKGIVQPLLNLAKRVWDSITHAISSAFHDISSWVVGEAAQIGMQIIHGILGGVSGLYQALKSKLEGGLRSVLSSLNPFSPVEHGGRIYIGEPIMQGAIDGVASMQGLFAKALADTVRQSVKDAGSALRSDVPTINVPISETFTTSVGLGKGGAAGSVSAPPASWWAQAMAQASTAANPLAAGAGGGLFGGANGLFAYTGPSMGDQILAASAARTPPVNVTVQGSVIGSDPQQLGKELGDIVEPFITRRRVAFGT